MSRIDIAFATRLLLSLTVVWIYLVFFGPLDKIQSLSRRLLDPHPRCHYVQIPAVKITSTNQVRISWSTSCKPSNTQLIYTVYSNQDSTYGGSTMSAVLDGVGPLDAWYRYYVDIPVDYSGVVEYRVVTNEDALNPMPQGTYQHAISPKKPEHTHMQPNRTLSIVDTKVVGAHFERTGVDMLDRIIGRNSTRLMIEAGTQNKHTPAILDGLAYALPSEMPALMWANGIRVVTLDTTGRDWQSRAAGLCSGNEPTVMIADMDRVQAESLRLGAGGVWRSFYYSDFVSAFNACSTRVAIARVRNEAHSVILRSSHGDSGEGGISGIDSIRWSKETAVTLVSVGGNGSSMEVSVYSAPNGQHTAPRIIWKAKV